MIKRKISRYSDSSRLRLLPASLLLIASISSTAQSPLPVEVVYPKPSQVSQSISLSGTVEAKHHARLAPLEAGRVSVLNVEIGDAVKQGDVLLTLDSKLAVLGLERVKADLNEAEVNETEAKRLYQEAVKLSKQQVVAQTLIAERAALVANAEAQAASARATLSLQQELLNRHSLRAPFDGVIAERMVDLGEWISQQSEVLTLVAQNDLRLSVAIPQQYYRQLVNQSSFGINEVQVKVSPDLDNSAAFTARLSRFVPVSNMATRAFSAQIDLPNNSGMVAGMSAKAEIMLPNTNSTTITLPKSAIKQHPDGGSSVFILDSGKAKRVITDYTSLPNEQIAITLNSTLLPSNSRLDNTAYIVTGIELLKDGMAVSPSPYVGQTQ